MGNNTGSCPPPPCLIELGITGAYQYCPITWNGNRSSVCKTPANGGNDDPVACNALIDFAVATGYANWTANGVQNAAAWLSGASYCSWPGVTCQSYYTSNGRLVVLNSSIVGLSFAAGEGFPAGSLVGTLPSNSTLGSLTALTSLRIDNHQNLTGTIPPTLLALKSLRFLQITRTGMSTQLNSFLQTSVAAMSQLGTLYVDGTYSGSWCTGTSTSCPLPALPSSLTRLQLAAVGLTGGVKVLPPSLNYLDLTNNPGLTSFSLSAANLTSNIQCCSNCYLFGASFSCLPSVLLNRRRCNFLGNPTPPAC
jgi:hypothetical protein